MKVNNEKIKSIVYIIAAIGISLLVPWGFYWLVDLGVYNYIINTVSTGRTDQIQAYLTWYSNYEWILFIIEFLLNISVTAVVFKYMLKLSLSNIKDWFPLQNIREFVIGLLLGVSAITIVFFTLVLTGNVSVTSWQPRFTNNVLKYLVVFILVGVSEELFYRGFIITCLRTYKNRWFAILFSSLIFSLVHFINNEFNLLAFLNIMLIGLMFAYAFLETKSLWLPIGYHILWNYFQGNVYGFHVSGITIQGIFTIEYGDSNLFNGGVFGPESGLITTLVTLLVILFLKLYLLNRKTASYSS